MHKILITFLLQSEPLVWHFFKLLQWLMLALKCLKKINNQQPLYRYTPQTVDLETKFRPFIPEYIPAGRYIHLRVYSCWWVYPIIHPQVSSDQMVPESCVHPLVNLSISDILYHYQYIKGSNIDFISECDHSMNSQYYNAICTGTFRTSDSSTMECAFTNQFNLQLGAKLH